MSVSTYEGLYLEEIEELAYLKYQPEYLGGLSLDAPEPSSEDLEDSVQSMLATLHQTLEEQSPWPAKSSEAKALKFLNERMKMNPVRYDLSDRHS
jgi:hypothetical protein